jgi:hypothetical protein
MWRSNGTCVGAILTHAGLTLTHVVKIKVFLKCEFLGKRSVLEYRPAQVAKRNVGSLPGRAGQFSPSDKLDVLFPKEFAKFLACKEVEIALAPRGAPSVAFKRGGLHFVISEG